MGSKRWTASKTLGFAAGLLLTALALTADLLTTPAVTATIPLAWAPASLAVVAVCVAVLRLFTGQPLAGSPAEPEPEPTSVDLLAYLNLTQAQQQAILRTLTILEQRLATVPPAPTPIRATPPPRLTLVPRNPPLGR